MLFRSPEVEAFALGEYSYALMKGDQLTAAERQSVVDKLHRFTGLEKEYLLQTNLRIEIGQFVKELRRRDGLTVGRLDGRFTGMDYDDAGERYEFDPSNSAITGPFAMAINDYVRRTLKYSNDLPYEVLGNRVAPWNYNNVQNQYLNTGETLRQAIHKNPALKVLICNGYYDLATPYYATDYTVNHLFVDPTLRGNITQQFYEAGHMMYIHGPSRAKLRSDVAAFLAAVCPAQAQKKQTQPPPPPPPPLQSLRAVPIPEPSNLANFVADKAAAIRLGKALFWDMQVGSDGITACASCHFHAGADSRAKNQLSPGLLRLNADGTPNPDKTFQVGGPNYTLKITDFPFHKLKNINDPNSTVLSSWNDVASSQGVLLEQFMGLDTNYNEIRFPLIDDVFRVGTLTTRRVEPRNSPTAINAIFNKRNFWDGRAQDFFNGVNPFGLRDANARVFQALKPSQVTADRKSTRLNSSHRT